MRGRIIVVTLTVLGLAAAAASYRTAPRFSPSATAVESTRFAPEVAPLGPGERRAYEEMRVGFGPGFAQSLSSTGGNGIGATGSAGSAGSASGSGIVPARGAEPSREQIREAFDTLAPAAPAGR